MKHILIIGAGKIGSTAAYLLHQSGRYKVTVADANIHFLQQIEKDGIAATLLNVNDTEALKQVMEDKDMVLNAGPFFINVTVAKAAAATQTHYFDFSEDVATTNTLRELAATAASSFMPQCGLAPGFISIAAHDLAKQFDELDTVKLRVGALPQYPTNSLKYNLTWSTDGLINEYCNPCDAIIDGKRVDVQPLEGLEHFSLNGELYEAFNTSGGLASLAEVLDGKVKNLDYKTARYPGHCALMKMLLFELGFHKKQDVLKQVFEDSLPFTPQDLVLVFVSVKGRIAGRLTEKIYTRKVFSQDVDNRHFTAIQLTTAGSACAVIDLHANGKLPQQGFIRQETVAFEDLMSSDFARFYK